MKTKVTQSPSIAARFIQHGELVAFPTETVYGLGANIFNLDAIRKIFTAKGRPADNPMIAHISELSQLESLTTHIPPTAQILIDRFFPGPLTVILPKSDKVPLIATAGLETIGVRMPDHPIAQQFLRACKVPVVAPSANISGRPSPTTWQAVRHDLDGRIGCLLRGDQTRVGLESTVVDCTEEIPCVLRAGAVTLEQLREVIPETQMAELGPDALTKSPGMKYRHYSPHARVVICTYPQYLVASELSAYIGLEAPPREDDFRLKKICADINEYAHSIFHFFRECDEAGVDTIYCQAVIKEGLGVALMDRIERAAHP